MDVYRAEGRDVVKGLLEGHLAALEAFCWGRLGAIHEGLDPEELGGLPRLVGGKLYFGPFLGVGVGPLNALPFPPRIVAW